MSPSGTPATTSWLLVTGIQLSESTGSPTPPSSPATGRRRHGRAAGRAPAGRTDHVQAAARCIGGDASARRGRCAGCGGRGGGRGRGGASRAGRGWGARWGLLGPMVVDGAHRRPTMAQCSPGSGGADAGDDGFGDGGRDAAGGPPHIQRFGAGGGDHPGDVGVVGQAAGLVPGDDRAEASTADPPVRASSTSRSTRTRTWGRPTRPVGAWCWWSK